MALQYVLFFKKRVCIKRMLQRDTLKIPDFAHVRKGTAFEGCAWLFGQQREAERKREEELEEGENLSRKFSPSSRAFNVINLLLFFLTEERSRAFFV